MSAIIGVIVVSMSTIAAITLKEKVKNSTVVYRQTANVDIDEDGNIKEEAVDALKNVENKNETEKKEDTNKVDSSASDNMNIKNPEKYLNQNQQTKNPVVEDSSINLALLGEIMMGGEVTNQLNYTYTNAVKNIYAATRSADFTYANFSTNITNLDTIENAKSKYLVNKNITKALVALGLDAVSIASDHMTDYPKEIVSNTKSVLEDSQIFVAGKQNMPVYFEKGNKKIAIISTNSVIIGTVSNYTNQEISMYSEENLKKNIKEAKESADVVIVDVHWGREYVYGVTAQMTKIAQNAIDNGADMVVGSHALGVYPIVEYKGKPIIYSTGYLMSDTDYYVGKEGFIFNINISQENKIEKITMTPTYIKDKKEVVYYKDYSQADTNICLNRFQKWHVENGLNSAIVDGKIEITF